MSSNLVTRQYYGSDVCYDNNGRAYTCRSAWYNWGRWVVLGAIVVGAFLIFFVFSCISSRRRRRMGRPPVYGTGWAGQAPFGHGQAAYAPNYPNTLHPPQEQHAPPAYNQTQNYGGYYGQNQGYFGGRGTDVEMQPPAPTAGQGVYNAPPGPPPAKK